MITTDKLLKYFVLPTIFVQNMRMKFRIINFKPGVQLKGETGKRKCPRARLLP